MKKIILIILIIVGTNTLFAQKEESVYFSRVKSPDLDVINYKKIKSDFKSESSVKFSDEACYFLLLFGENASIKMPVVVDKSSPDSKKYDLLYIDRNVNGIIEEKNEVIKCTKSLFGYIFELDDWRNPATGELSKASFSFRKAIGNEKILEFEARLAIQNKRTIAHFELLEPNKPKTAKKVWVGFEKPLTIRSWGEFSNNFYKGLGKVEGSPYGDHIANERTFLIAYPGSDDYAFWLVDMYYLSKNEYLVAEVDYTTIKGENKLHKSKLEKRC